MVNPWLFIVVTCSCALSLDLKTPPTTHDFPHSAAVLLLVERAETEGFDYTEQVKLDGVKVNFNQLLSAMMNLTKKVPSYTSKYKDPETPVDDEDM